ncbi:TlpA disulfide reductase family protein [Geothrix sp. 21YS21S-2]|uniref:TlpA disulfide reductase family protein n=1 Tax=Geothrix sp. 21YS21S-2 TaxID=3068893 RepID=UPI0027BA34B2|nr:TlpA disulfide reductase family protein [Geothrix sp. 21YS21S-2]
MILLGAGLMLASMAAPSVQAAPKPASQLRTGDPAPALGGVRWIKGAPGEGFKPGQAYVVEFWATWCHPCRLVMPHLSKLAREYKGKVTFLGISIMEPDKDLKVLAERLDGFVAGMGDQMDYNVGQDTADKLIERTWARAAGRSSIPCTFVVDGKGRIAWIGHPAYLEGVLPAVLRGAFDARAFDGKLEALKKVQGEFTGRFKAADYAGALAMAEALPADDPVAGSAKRYMQLLPLLHLDPARAEKVYREMERHGETDAYLADTLVAQKGIPDVWYARAVELVKAASRQDSESLHLAEVQFKTGRKADALETLKAYSAHLKELQARNPGKAKAYEPYLQVVEAKRMEYQQAK